MTTDQNGTKPNWLKPGSNRHTSPATIAAQLHAIADAIATLGDQPLSEVDVSVDIQALQHRPHRDRVAAVDLLAQALQLRPRVKRLVGGDVHYGFDYEQARPVNVYANVVSDAEFEEGQLLAGSACGRCKQPFDPADKSFDGAARYGESRWCKGCVDRCHESTDFAHECVICAPAVTR